MPISAVDYQYHNVLLSTIAAYDCVPQSPRRRQAPAPRRDTKSA